MNLPCNVLRALAAPALFCAVALGQLDTRADYQPMFLPSGPQGQQTLFQLSGGAPPVLGQWSTMSVHAPGFLFGGVIASFGAHSAQPFPLPNGQTLLIYIDMGLQLGTLPLHFVQGQAVAQFRLPPDPLLAGVDLAWQAYGIDRLGQLGTSNLLASNLGFSPFSGVADFASFAFGPVAVSGRSYYETNNVKQAIISNETANKITYTITGTKGGGGPLELRDQTGAVLSTVAATDSIISKTISVPAGTKVYWYNAGGGAINGLTWSIQAS